MRSMVVAGLKVRCAAITPRPRNAGRAYAFQSHLIQCLCCRVSRVVADHARTVPGVELGPRPTRLSAVSGQPALNYHVPTSPPIRSGWQELQPTSPSANDHPLRGGARRVRRYPTSRSLFQSETAGLRTGDLLAPHPRPKQAGAPAEPGREIPRLRYVLPFSSSCGVELSCRLERAMSSNR